jgi:hypothetical protein
MKIIVSIIIFALVILCLYFVLKNTDYFTTTSVSSTTSSSNSKFNNLSKDFLSKIQNQQSKLTSIHARIVPKKTKSVKV